nr:hypothetical protein [uncultured Sphingosinicella sp.]
MAEAKPFASLSSGLLARKGAAKPAMRPQGFGQGMGLEDLGWNDMGHGHAPTAPAPFEERPEHVPSSISALTPAPRSPVLEEPVAPSPPVVVEQQRAIEASFAEDADRAEEADFAEEANFAEEAEREAPKPVVVKAKAEVVKLPPRPRSSPGAKGRAAFTLRLDAERHLKLRLACAVTHRSAQQIVSDALESFLASLPELDAIAGQVPASFGKRG